MKMNACETLAFAEKEGFYYRIWGHVHVNRFTRPHTVRNEFYTRRCEYKPARKEALKHAGSIEEATLNGTYGGYFDNEAEAKIFVQEILDGKHPGILSEAAERDVALDFMDEALGICDRGLGTFDTDNRGDFELDLDPWRPGVSDRDLKFNNKSGNGSNNMPSYPDCSDEDESDQLSHEDDRTLHLLRNSTKRLPKGMKLDF